MEGCTMTDPVTNYKNFKYRHFTDYLIRTGIIMKTENKIRIAFDSPGILFCTDRAWTDHPQREDIGRHKGKRVYYCDGEADL